ncbi:MAG: purine-nucleoside phosphorylase [Rhodobacteraceae bacterium]|nr:purine-nucleoside phosphorylase [Paracoccaceae bacterium]
MSLPLGARITAARDSIAGQAGAPVAVGLVLGSGLGALAERMRGAVAIPYGEIAGMPVSTAPGHAGQLLLGELFGTRCALMQGRLHLYEGWAAADIALPIYLLKALGARSLVVTNAAGALNPAFAPGEVMLIEDHINLTGANPLTGPNDESVGLRFPDMSRAYDPELRARAKEISLRHNFALKSGIYAGICGPSLETSAERRFLRAAGGDAVGMSTVIEVIAAAHCGLRVLGFSAITNAAAGGPDQQPDTIEEVLENAAVAGLKMAALLEELVPRL